MCFGYSSMHCTLSAHTHGIMAKSLHEIWEWKTKKKIAKGVTFVTVSALLVRDAATIFRWKVSRIRKPKWIFHRKIWEKCLELQVKWRKKEREREKEKECKLLPNRDCLLFWCIVWTSLANKSITTLYYEVRYEFV